MERYSKGSNTKYTPLQLYNNNQSIETTGLPMITMKNQSIQELSQTMMGHRNDENCHLNRTHLMIEKARRLGDNAKPLAKESSSRSGSTKLEQVLKREIFKRKHPNGPPSNA